MHDTTVKEGLNDVLIEMNIKYVNYHLAEMEFGIAQTSNPEFVTTYANGLLNLLRKQPELNKTFDNTIYYLSPFHTLSVYLEFVPIPGYSAHRQRSSIGIFRQVKKLAYETCAQCDNVAEMKFLLFQCELLIDPDNALVIKKEMPQEGLV